MKDIRAFRVIKRWGILKSGLLVFARLAKMFKNKSFLKYLDEEYSCNLIDENGFNIKSEGNFWVINLKTNQGTIFCRKFSSDLAVFKQIFLQDDLLYLFERIKDRNISIQN